MNYLRPNLSYVVLYPLYSGIQSLMAYDVFYLASRVATEFEKICDCKMNHNCDYVYRMNRLLDPKSFNI